MREKARRAPPSPRRTARVILPWAGSVSMSRRLLTMSREQASRPIPQAEGHSHPGTVPAWT